MDDSWKKFWDYLYKKPVLSLLLSVIVLFVAGGEISRGIASHDWPTTQGVITSSEYVREDVYDEDGAYSLYFARVSYRYSVNESVYNSDNFGLGDGGRAGQSRSTDGYAKEIVRRYPVGKQVKVFYDPDNPEFAVLEPGTPWQCLIGLGVGFFFLIVGLLGILESVRKLIGA